ncbi:pyridine nucleotide-disulfide oxidoreductase-domain-containing protein [Stachybotrys elegans]|uniref:Pyridine nucleotide-disulfide oxidoreductase-domain-containing protein n=1 Tax=Stachybotrys elegans TaxID=80388 RepID=A0A8K0WWB4_9HYPO|nr:pyridine nucleotide-disulfide oxidoreductase-domain-containing protein [Stachybotrys elegans]
MSLDNDAGTYKATDKKRPRVVILGSGWAGYALARTLSPSKTTRVVISPRSHFVFTPLLASTTVGTLEFRTVVEPVRRLGNVEFHQAWACEVDFASKKIVVEACTQDEAAAKTGIPLEPGERYEIGYDKLVIAVGAWSQTFGIEGVREHANFLRDVGDARTIRLKVLQAFEKASQPTTSDADRKKLLHFAIVGGGPTGVEFAAELHDLVHDDLAKLYPELAKFVAITIYDIAPKVLPMFDQNLGNYATELFRREGINVKTEHHLNRIRKEGDTLVLSVKEEAGGEVGAGLVVWSTGLMQNPLVKQLVSKELRMPASSGDNGKGGSVVRLAKDDKTGGLHVDGHLRVQTRQPSDPSGVVEVLPDVYAIGDCAVLDEALPATAQVASQQAIYLGKQLNREAKEASSSAATPAPFKFRNWGTMAYLGSWRAIHQKGSQELKGRAAWLLWRTAYLTKSMSVRNKIMVPVYWLITWIFGRDISRF